LLFELKDQDSKSKARTGTIHLPHGPVDTPVFMPVGTNATVKAIHHDTVKSMGTQIILSNTYHLYLRPGIDVIKAAGGLHAFSNWQGNILTDSGGFQVFSLSGLRKISDQGVRFQSHIDGSKHLLTPETVVDLQVGFGSDIMMALDVCTAPEISEKKALEALIQTTKWAKRTKDHWLKAKEEGYPGQLFGIVQGNFFPELRKRSALEIAELDTPGIAVGGLSVGEPFHQFEEFTASTCEYLPPEKPHYLMGIGTPDFIFTAVEHGIDMFDCVLPTRIARNGTVFTADGYLPLKKAFNEADFGPIEEGCPCTACTKYSRAYLRHMFKAGEIYGPMLATEHNLMFLHRMMMAIRQSIAEDRFLEYKASFLRRYLGK
jgi:queuine tRNA-ribosyltransferase